MYSCTFFFVFLFGYSFCVVVKDEGKNKTTLRAPGEGKQCFVKKLEHVGLCTNLDHCEYAKDLLKAEQWQRPQQCDKYFVGIYPIVCCPVPKSEIICQIYHTPKEPCITLEVAGGEKSVAKEFPHMAALGYGEIEVIQWFCGGSLISEQFVLTAAHCIDTTNYGVVRWVRLGDLDLHSDNDTAQPQDFTVSETFIHPNYEKKIHYHDIALIKLDRTARFSDFVQPACLHSEFPVPTELTISGWGKVDIVGDVSSHLLKADIFSINQTTCAAKFQSWPGKKLSKGIVSTIQVCAGHPEGKDTCPGDSGGPLQYKLKQNFLAPHYRIVGVTSFGQGCGYSNSVGVYTRVSAYYQWIEDIVWPAKYFKSNMML